MNSLIPTDNSYWKKNETSDEELISTTFFSELHYALTFLIYAHKLMFRNISCEYILSDSMEKSSFW
jgi:hypothetical protein